jgi:zinc transport system substrate-binding protein
MCYHTQRNPGLPTATLLILCGLAALLLAGCAPPRGAAGAGKPVVAVSIFPLADWVQEIAGDAVQVICVLPPGGNPHTFEPTPQTAEDVELASLRVVIGLGVDDWAKNLAAPHAETLVLSDGMATVPMIGDEPNEPNGPNPHLWLDPVRAAQMLDKLIPALEKIAPGSKAQIEQRGRAYQAQLRALGDEMAQACKPYAGRQIITMHNAYDYFLLRCGLPQEHVITPFPGKEPSAKYLEELGTWARQNKVHIIFAEPLFSPKTAEVLAQEINGQVLQLDELGNPEVPERDTYVKLIRWNLKNLLQGLAVK